MGVDKIHAAFQAAEPVGDAEDSSQQHDTGTQDCPPDIDGDPGHMGDPGDMDDMGEAPPPGLSDEDQQLARAAAFPLNDFGNGQRLMEYYGEDVLYVPRLGWYRWAKKFWRPDEDELDVRRDAQKIAGRILEEIKHIALEPWETDALDLWATVKSELTVLEKVKDQSEEQKDRQAALREIRLTGERISERLTKAKAAHRAHAKNTGNSSKISNMLAEAKVAAATTVGALNTDKLMLNCENGVLNFTRQVDPFEADWGDATPKWRVDLLPHDRRHLISKMVLAEYDPAAICPHFLKFLETVQPSEEMRAFIQRWAGYSLTGLTVEQKLAFFFGGGRNGKSTLVEILARIVADYGTTIPIETLTGTEQRKGSDATPDLVKLPGARFVRASEPEQGQRMKEALIKALTGGEPIMIRRMQQEFVEIVPEFKLTISGNYRPEIRGSDDGIWRRILLVPFAVQIADEDVDQMLPDKLWAERAGILSWMVEGCLDYLKNGLQPPASVTEATAEYRKDSDPLREFLTTECEITGSNTDFSTGRDLADAFNAWLLWRGYSVWGKRKTANEIKARADSVKGATGLMYTYGKRSDTGYLGIRISQDALDRMVRFGDEVRAGVARKG
jgi:putative DNA primase/helicase